MSKGDPDDFFITRKSTAGDVTIDGYVAFEHSRPTVNLQISNIFGKVDQPDSAWISLDKQEVIKLRKWLQTVEKDWLEVHDPSPEATTAATRPWKSTC